MCDEDKPYEIIETHECVDYCDLNQLLSEKCKLQHIDDIIEENNETIIKDEKEILQSQMEISMHRKERMILVREETSLSMVAKSLSMEENSGHKEETFSSTTEQSLLKAIVVSNQMETLLSMAVK